MPTSATVPVYIDQTPALADFCQAIAGCSWLAMDTEFLRDKTYYPQFCLLQIAAGDQVACIDPLALTDLGPLLEILYDPNITKVLHAARQDMEIFYHLHGKLPSPVFDTQIAAPLLGIADQIGYAGLVQELLGAQLEKGHSRTDWSQRPLNAEQLKYAADDVIYLARLYPKMLQRLEKLGRLDWLTSDCQALCEPDVYENPPETAWLRLSGAYKMKGAALSIIQTLAAWRERTAQQENLPRGWVLKDDVLFDLARLQPKTPVQLQTLRALAERTVKRHGEEICALVRQALAQPPQALPQKSRPSLGTPDKEALLDLLGAVVRLLAERHTLNPAVVAGRKDLEALAAGEADCKLREGWRYHLVGAELEALLRGEHQLSVSDGRLLLEPRLAAK
ncbi:MAG: ribonuclease D [Methylococcaceae bacterium]|nr:MAG: ribonuclease D [Methylococcaceae bacterium]